VKPFKLPAVGALLGRLPRLVTRSAKSASAPRRPAPAPVPGRVLSGFRLAALSAIAAVITTASAASFAESYRGLWLWARHHGLSGFWAAAFPLQVDAFIVVGELSLFIAMTDRWRLRDRAGAWLVALAGLGVSVAGNIGHVAGADLQTRGTAAVPPLAAFAALWVGLGVLKRTLNRRDQTAQTADDTGRPAAATAPPDAAPLAVADASSAVAGMLSAPVPADAEHAALIALRATLAAGNPLSNNQLMTRFGLTRAQVAKVRQQATGNAADQETSEDLTAV
jgi:hypothetical protein